VFENRVLRRVFMAEEGRGDRREVCIECWWGNLRERGHWRDPDVDLEDNIKMDVEVGGGCGDWMELAQDRDRWRGHL
jgi:hypothetical protein